MSHITAIGTASPENKFSQEVLANFMVKAMQLNYEESRILKTLFKASGIDTRYSVLQDYGLNNNFTFYSNTPDFEPFPSTERRLKVFREHALNISVKAIDQALNKFPDFDKR